MENHTEMRLWREHFAKCVIEDHFPEIGPLTKAERPDLHGDHIGIEVVQARPKWFEKRDSMIENLCATRIEAQRAEQMGDVNKAKKCRKKISELKRKNTPDPEDGVIICHLPTDFPAQSEQAVVNGIRKKLRLLNKGNYDSFDQIGLFLWSTIAYSDQNASIDWKQLVTRGCSVDQENYSKHFDFFFVFCEPTSYVVHLSGSGDFIESFHVNASKYDSQLKALSRDS